MGTQGQNDPVALRPERHGGSDCARMLAEVDRLLNDPRVPMEPTRVWALVIEIARCEGTLARPAGA